MRRATNPSFLALRNTRQISSHSSVLCATEFRSTTNLSRHNFLHRSFCTQQPTDPLKHSDPKKRYAHLHNKQQQQQQDQQEQPEQQPEELTTPQQESEPTKRKIPWLLIGTNIMLLSVSGYLLYHILNPTPLEQNEWCPYRQSFPYY